MSIKTFELNEKPKHPMLCWYGPPGSGKTTLIASMPGRGIVIDTPTVEGGTYVISDQSDRIKGVRLDEWEDIDEIFWALLRGDTKALPALEMKPNWIAVDSLTGMYEAGKRKIIRERDRSLGEDPHKITLQEYGWIGQLVGEMVYRFKQLPYWTIWTAQERRHGGGDDDPGQVQYGPSVTRSVLNMLAPPTTILGRLGVSSSDDGKEQRVLEVGPPDGLYIVKARNPPGKKLPNKMLNPNMNEVLQYLYGDGKRPKTARDIF